MDVSIIICTYNRCRSLCRTLESIASLEVPDALQWELLVVDNNSSDNTRRVCEEHLGKIPLRYDFEPVQGKSHALNRSVGLAAGELLLFTDDDVDVDGRWLASLWDAAARYSDSDYFGGKSTPVWEDSPPRWLIKNSATMGSLLASLVVRYDFGPEVQPMPQAFPFFGANLAVRKAVFDAGWRFDPKLGPHGLHAINGEESDFLRRLRASGHKGLYIPSAVVYHRNSMQRATERYVRHYFTGAGRKEVRVGNAPSSSHLWFGAPWNVWLRLVVRSLMFVLTRFLSPSRVWLSAEIRMAWNWGRICEYRDEFRRRGTCRRQT